MLNLPAVRGIAAITYLQQNSTTISEHVLSVDHLVGRQLLEGGICSCDWRKAPSPSCCEDC